MKHSPIIDGVLPVYGVPESELSDYLRRESFSGTCAPRHNAHKVAPESCNKPSGAIFVSRHLFRSGKAW